MRATLLVLSATAPIASGEHGQGGTVSDDAEQLIVRVLLLTASAMVAGIGVLAPFDRHVLPARRVLIGAAAGLALVIGLPAITHAEIRLDVLAVHLALLVAVPILLHRRWIAFLAGAALLAVVAIEATFAHTGAERWIAVVHVAAAALLLGGPAVVATAAAAERRGLARKLLPIAVVAGLAVAVTGVLEADLAGVGLDGRLYGTAFGILLSGKTLLLIGLGVLGLVMLRRRRLAGRGAPFRVMVIGLAAALAAGSALAAIPLPTLPDSGVPMLRTVNLDGEPVPVFVSPHRPGTNLVHVGGDDADRLSVGLDKSDLRPAAARPGAAGAWAELDLPAGQSTLWLRRAGQTVSLALDTGDVRRSGTAPRVAGPDGPECASAALGRVLAEDRTPLSVCPSERLGAADARALRGLVDFLAARRPRSVSVLGDSSARARAAERLVRARLTQAGVTVHEGTRSGDALVVLAGWSVATSELRQVSQRQARIPTFPYGSYLAPWLLTAPVVESTANAVLPLRYDPHARLPMTYAAALAADFPGEPPSGTGYQAWLAARPDPTTGPLRLYSASRVAFLPEEFEHQHTKQGWFPGGSIVPVTTPGSAPRASVPFRRSRPRARRST